MSCSCARSDGEGRYLCSVSGDECLYMIPNSIRCAKEYGEGPDADLDEDELQDKYDKYQEELEDRLQRSLHTDDEDRFDVDDLEDELYGDDD